jgi:sulfonate transport system ATP-binding protein
VKGSGVTLTAESDATTRGRTDIAGELRNVDKWYGNRQVLNDVSVRVKSGEIVALLGRSGSGKSTVLRVLAGLSRDHSGQRVVSGAPALAFQEPRLFPWRDVRTNVGYGLTRSRLPRQQVRKRAERALADVGLADHADAWPLTLSGGQAQRVSLARALVAEPKLLLLDEPFGALDALTRLTMHTLLLDLWRRHGFGVLLITHDVDEAVALADRVLVLEEGRVIHTLTIDEPRRAPGDPGPHTEQHRAELLDRLGVRL